MLVFDSCLVMRCLFLSAFVKYFGKSGKTQDTISVSNFGHFSDNLQQTLKYRCEEISRLQVAGKLSVLLLAILKNAVLYFKMHIPR